MTEEEFYAKHGVDPALYEYDEKADGFVRRQQAPAEKLGGKSSALGTAARAARDNAGAITVGAALPSLLMGTATGAGLMSGVGTLPTLAILGGLGLAGSAAGGFAQSKANEALEEKPGAGSILKTSDEQAEIDKKEHRYAKIAGSLVPMLATGKPGWQQLRDLSTATKAARAGLALAPAEKAAVAGLAVNTGLQGGLVAKRRYSGEEIDPLEEAAGFASGLALTPHKFLGGGQQSVNRDLPKRGKLTDVASSETTSKGYSPSHVLPEGEATVLQQFKLVNDPLAEYKKAIFLVKGSPKIPDTGGLIPFEMEKGTLWVNPKKVSRERLDALEHTTEVPGDLLGYLNPSKPPLTEVVNKGYRIVSVEHGGTPEVISEIVPNSDEAVAAAIAHHTANRPKNVAPDDWIVKEETSVDTMMHRKQTPVTPETSLDAKKSALVDKSLGKLEAKQTKEETALINKDAALRGKDWEKQQADEEKFKKDFEAELEKEAQANAKQSLAVLKAGDLIKKQLPLRLKKLEKQAEAESIAGDEALTKADELTTKGDAEWEKQNDLIDQSLAKNAEKRNEMAAKQQAIKDKIANTEAAKIATDLLPRGVALPSKRSVQDATLAGEPAAYESIAKRRKYTKPLAYENIPDDPTLLPQGKGDAENTALGAVKGKVRSYDPNEPFYQTAEAEPQQGTTEELGAFVRHLSDLGNKVQVAKTTKFTTASDPTLRYGKESAAGIEVNPTHAETPAHEAIHRLLREDPAMAAQFKAAVESRAAAANLTPEEYLATKGGKTILEMFSKNDTGFIKDIVNLVKHKLGNTSDEVLGRLLANKFFYGVHKTGGNISQLGNVGFGDTVTNPNYQPAVFSQLGKVADPKARENLEKAYNQRTFLQGKLAEALQQKLEAFPIADVASTVAKHRELYRNGKTSAFTSNEMPISKILTDHFDMVEGMQHATGYDRDIQGNPYYIPDQLSADIHNLLGKGLSDPQVQNVVKAIGDHWNKANVPNAHKEAEDYILGVAKARFGATAVERADGFDALRKAAGHGLPEMTVDGIPVRESDPVKLLTDYGRRAAGDMAWQKNIVNQFTPEQIKVFESEKDSPWQAVRSEYWNQDHVDNPTLRQASRVATSGVLGPLTGLAEVASTPHNAMLQGANLGDVAKAVAKVVSNFKGEKSVARETGRLKAGLQDDAFGRVVEGPAMAANLSKAADVISKYSGRQYLEQVSRVMSSSISDATAARKFREGDAKWFENLAVDINDPNAVAQAATTMTEMIQGRRDSRDLPPALTKGVLSDIAPIHKWAVGHAGEVLRKVRAGDFSDLVKYVAAGLGVGVGRQELAELIKGRRTNEASHAEIVAAGKEGTTHEVSWMVDILRAAGIGGALTDIASIPLNLAAGKQAQLIYNPLAEAINSNLIHLPAHIMEAMDAGIPNVQIAESVVENLFRNSFQAYRIIDDLSKGGEEVAREEDRRDLRVFKQLNGQKAFSGEYNPIVARANKRFQEAEDFPTAEEAVKYTTVKRTPRNYVMPEESPTYLDYLDKAGDHDVDRKLERSARLEYLKPSKRALLQQKMASQ